MIIKHAARSAGTRDRLLGLLAYLAGPGRDEEHVDQRLVAGWSEEIAELDLRDEEDRLELARLMEAPARLRQMSPPRDGFVYHVAISLHADDGQLSDAQWAYVAGKVVATLGMQECRWVAVHHGMARSAEGPRDHVHLVVHRAREDGTVASTWRDRVKMAAVRAELEDDPALGLRVSTRRRCGGRDGWTQGERRRAAQAGRQVPDREQLERIVRGAAGGAASEGEWVLQMRRAGALVRPRYAPGGQAEVVGYSVAMPPEQGRKPVWFSGGKLAKDLALPAMRRRWPGHDPSTSLGAWSAQAGQRARQTRMPETVWPQAHAALEQYDQALRQTPPDAVTMWRAYARESADMLSALLPRVPAAERVAVHRAAVHMARVAETPDSRDRGLPSRGAAAARSACQVITHARLSGRGGTAALVQLTMQLVRTVETIRRANAAVDDAASARHAALAVRGLTGLGERLGDPRRANAALQKVTMAPLSPGREPFGRRRAAIPARQWPRLRSHEHDRD